MAAPTSNNGRKSKKDDEAATIYLVYYSAFIVNQFEVQHQPLSSPIDLAERFEGPRGPKRSYFGRPSIASSMVWRAKESGPRPDA